jgi:hypothetical protein
MIIKLLVLERNELRLLLMNKVNVIETCRKQPFDNTQNLHYVQSELATKRQRKLLNDFNATTTMRV